MRLFFFVQETSSGFGMDPWCGDEEWQKYSDIDNEIIEDAFNEKKKEVEIDDGYVINFREDVQYRKEDRNKQRRIKRITLETDRNNLHLREDRFSFPVAVSNEADESSAIFYPNRHLTYDYYKMQLEYPNQKTVANVIEEAAEGIIIEGQNIGKFQQAQWLARQLVIVKEYGANVKVRLDSMNRRQEIPSVIGETCVYLYTKESFWYKLLNRLCRQSERFTTEQIKTLGPFSFLLDIYLKNNCTRKVKKVYRGLNLTDEQRKYFMPDRKLVIFKSFTSTSINRKKAEQFGDTLLIIDLHSNERYFYYILKFKNQCGASISHLSDFPEEEEFLL